MTELSIENMEREAKKYSSRSSLCKNNNTVYQKATKLNILDDICSHMVVYTFRELTFDFCARVAKKCKTRREFQDLDQSAYHKCRKKGWLDKVCNHMQPSQHKGGFRSRTQFAELCKTRGISTFYIVRLFDEHESFYKFGITSQLIEQRYKGYTFWYDYEILDYFESGPEVIFDFEHEFKNASLKFKYFPQIQFDGSTECFKCNSNNALLTL